MKKEIKITNKTTKAKTSITKDMTIGEVVSKNPETAFVFLEYGMHCIGCAVANSETIERGALAHGINVDNLVAHLNKTMINY